MEVHPPIQSQEKEDSAVQAVGPDAGSPAIPAIPGSPFRRWPAPFQIVFFAALLCGLYWAVLQACRGQAELAESNLQSNLIRASNYFSDPDVDIVLAGTSITGRLLPTFFEQRGVRTANLGMDGGTTLFALDIFERHKPLPKLLLVETNFLFQPRSANDEILDAELNSVTAWIGLRFPLFQPQYRLSSVFYTWSKMFNDNRKKETPPPGGAPVKAALEPSRSSAGPAPLSPGTPKGRDETYALVAQRLRQLQQKGVTILLVQIPAGKKWSHSTEGLTAALAKELDLRFVNIDPIIASQGRGVTFTDGLHLSMPSARIVVDALSDQIAEPPNGGSKK